MQAGMNIKKRKTRLMRSAICNRMKIFQKSALLLVFALIITVSGCNQGGRQAQIDVTEIIADTTFINVFYFRIKQRCETCNTVAAVARNTIETAFAGNEKVRYIEFFGAYLESKMKSKMKRKFTLVEHGSGSRALIMFTSRTAA